MDLVEKAKEFAARKHATQTRKYTEEPYANHLAAVVHILKANGVEKSSVLAAAYLHDVVEDTETQLQEIIKEFGDEVAELVYWLTDAEEGNRASRKLMSAWRLSRAPWDAKLIKLADIIDNAASISEHDPHFIKVFGSEKQAILNRMADVEGVRLSDLPLFKEAKRAGRA